MSGEAGAPVNTDRDIRVGKRMLLRNTGHWQEKETAIKSYKLVNRWMLIQYSYAGRGASKWYETLDDLPEQVRERYAVLSILHDDTDLEGVGKRVDDTTYWIEP